MDGQAQARLGGAGATGPEGHATEVEHGERDFQTLAERPKGILLRNGHVAEREPSGRRAADAQFSHARFQDDEARHVRRYKEGGNGCFVFARNGCARHDGEHLRNGAIGDVTLFTVENEV
jgi:hypothetical protein